MAPVDALAFERPAEGVARPRITVNVGGRGYHVHLGSSNGNLFPQDITPNQIRCRLISRAGDLQQQRGPGWGLPRVWLTRGLSGSGRD